MVTNTGVEVSRDIYESNVRRILSQTFALLPTREEGKDWIKPLETLAVETIGLAALLPQEDKVLRVASKLQGLLEQKDTCDFPSYRRTVFECCNLLSKILES